jgi:hypothetical protein
MRRIEMTPVGQLRCSTCHGEAVREERCPRCGGTGAEPTVIEMVEGKRYFAVVRCPEGATEANRKRATETVARCVDRPEHPCSVVSLPFGYQLDVYEEAASLLPFAFAREIRMVPGEEPRAGNAIGIGPDGRGRVRGAPVYVMPNGDGTTDQAKGDPRCPDPVGELADPEHGVSIMIDP